MATRHIAVATWLEALGMLEYTNCFTQFHGVENMLYLTETEIRDMGITNAAHRAKIVSSLRLLKEKYERSTLPGKKNSLLNQVQRSQSVTAQLTGSPPSPWNSPDYQQIDVSPERLQHDLLIELQGDPADLKSKAWYHGSISRQRADRLIAKNGDFLVRDCISQPGDFVLTCCWKGGPLHFVINSSVIDQGPYKLPKVTYHFEDTHFKSVQDLIQFYMDECKPITEISGAVITTPIARTMPLTYYDSKYGALAALANSQADHYSNVLSRTPGVMPPQSLQTRTSPYASPAVSPVNLVQSVPRQKSPHVTPGVSPRASPHGSPKVSPQGTPGTSPGGSPQSDRRHRYNERSGSQPLLSINDVPVVITPELGRSGSLPVITGINRQVSPLSDMSRPFPLSDSGIYKTVTPNSGGYQSLPLPMTGTAVSGHQSSLPPLPPHSAASQPGNTPHQSIQQKVAPVYIHQRSGSAPVLTPGVTVTQHFDYLAPPQSLNPSSSDSDLSKAPPPKPSRIPSVKYKQKPHVQIRNKALYEDDSRDYSDYSQVTSEPSWLKPEEPANQKENRFKTANQMRGDSLYDNNMQRLNQSNTALQERDLNQNLAIKEESRKISETRFDVLDGHDYADVPAFPLELDLHRGQSNAKDQISNLNIKNKTQNLKPKVKIPSIESEPSLKWDTYASVLLPNENKLLEPSTLIKVRDFLLNTKAKDLARYLTKVDLDILKVLNEDDLGVKVTSGLELITLPQGKQLRQEILERIFCVKAFVMVLILTCQKVTDRASMLSQWIQIAMETKGTMGNLFSFENIMAGLMSDQILRLRDTWMVLRQNHTGSAYLFDTKLKSSFRMLHDGSGSLPVQDICIPAINPIVQLMERTLQDQSSLPWESTDITSGLDIMLIHLDIGRVVTAQCGVYRVTGNSLMKDLEMNAELTEMFQTEFHLRFLWGMKGAGANRTERHNKFMMLLTAYSEKIEKEGDDGTAV